MNAKAFGQVVYVCGIIHGRLSLVQQTNSKEDLVGDRAMLYLVEAVAVSGQEKGNVALN